MKQLYTLLLLVYVTVTVAQTSEQNIALQDLYIDAHQDMLLGEYDDAIAKYEKILDDDPTNASSYHDLCRIYLAQKEYEKAIKSGKNAIKLNPKELWYRHTLSDVYGASEQYSLQADELGELIRLRSDVRLYEKQIDALKKAQRTHDAIKALRVVMRKYGMREGWVDETIDLHLQYNADKEIIKLLEDYITDAPHQIDRKVKLGEYYMYRQKFKKANRVFGEILSVEPANEKALFNKRILDRSATGKKDPVLSIVNDPTKSMDEKIISLIPLVRSLESNTGHQGALLQGVQNLMDLSPHNARLHALRGDIYYMTNGYTDAIDDYNTAIEIDPSIYRLWSQLLDAYERSGQYKELGQKAEQAMDYFPNLSEPYYYKALALSKQDRIEDAQEHLYEADMINAGDADMGQRIAILSAQMLYKVDAAQGINRLLQYVETYGESAVVSELIGDLYKKEDKVDKAQEYWQKAIALGGDKARITTKLQSL